MTLSVVESSDGYRFISKPNCSLTSSGKIKVVLLLMVIPICVAVVFSLLGAWLILPFAGLEIFALGFAFYHVHSHAEDYESISIDGDSLVIERCNRQHISQFVLNPYWAKVMSYKLPSGELRLGLQSHGNEVEIGRYLTQKQRASLARQLQKHTGTFCKKREFKKSLEKRN